MEQVFMGQGKEMHVASDDNNHASYDDYDRAAAYNDDQHTHHYDNPVHYHKYHNYHTGYFHNGAAHHHYATATYDYQPAIYNNNDT